MENSLVEPCCSSSIQNEVSSTNEKSEIEPPPASMSQMINGNIFESAKVQVVEKNGKYTSLHLQEPSDEDRMKAERDLMAQFEWNGREVIMICLIMFLGSITLGLIIAHIQASKSMAIKQEEHNNCTKVAISYRDLLIDRNVSRELEARQNKNHIALKNFLGVANQVSSDAESISYDGGSSLTTELKFTNRRSIVFQLESYAAQNRLDYWKSVRISSVDGNKAACQDFQKYACGQWLKSRYSKLLNSTTGSWSIYDELQETVEKELLDFVKQPNEATDNDAVRFARLQFHTCSNDVERARKGVEPLRDLLKKLCLNNYETNCSLEIDSPTGLANFIRKLHFEIGVSTLFKSFVAPAMWNASVNALYLADNVTPLLDLAANAANAAKQRERFNQFLRMDNLFSRSALKDLTHVGHLLYNLSFQNEDEIEPASPRLSWKRIDVEELQTIIPQIDWREFTPFNGVNISLMIKPSLFRGLHSVLSQITVRQMRHYFTWSVVIAWWPYLDASRVDMYNAMIVDLQNRTISTSTAKWKVCLNSLDKETLSAIYEQRIHPSSALETEHHVLPILMQWIRKAWLDQLRFTPNLSTETRTFLLNKIENVQLRSTSAGARRQLNFSTLLKNGNESYFNLIFALQQHQLQKKYSQIGHVNQLSPEGSFIVNGFYASQYNLIELPRAHLRWPFLVSGETWANRFASLGTLIAHEMYHAVDNEGGCFLSNGSLSSLCHTYPQSVQRKCILHEWKINTSNKYLVDELLADTYGLHIAFKAYEMWSQAQNREEKISLRNFLLHYAQTNCGMDLLSENMVQTHALWKGRVNIPIKLFPKFYHEFRCENFTSTVFQKPCGLI